MFLNPIIPVWIMVIISIILIVVALIALFRQKSNLIEKIIRISRIVLIIALVFVINLRPMFEDKGNQEVMMSNLNVLFVIDNTISMFAEDYNGNSTRMSAVKKDTNYIMDELKGASFGLISFDNDSKVLCPFTADIESVEDAISILNSVTYFYAKGSSLNKPIDKMEELLKSSSKKEEKRTICFFISDGEITDDSRLESYKSLAKYLSGGAVLGYGTTQGGKMKSSQDSDDYTYYLHDYETHDDAISKIDEKNLNKIAEDLEVDYVKMDRQSNIDKVLSPIKKLAIKESAVSKKNSGKDIYYFFAIPLLMLIVWEFIDFRRRVN